MTLDNKRRKVKPVDNRYVASEEGKIPPQATEFEESVLGGLMLEAGRMIKIANILTKESFYKEENAFVYEAIYGLYKQRKPIDILTVTEELKKMGKLEEVGGAYYITQLTNRVTSTANIEYHALIIQEHYFLREIIRKSYELASKSFDDAADCFDLIDEAKTFFNSLENININKTKTATEIAKNVKTEINTDITVIGKLSGITILDYRLGGAHDTDLIILAGRPGKGKTVLMMHYLKKQIMSKIKVSAYSYEMTAEQLVLRLVSMHQSIKNNAIRAKKLTAEQKKQIEEYLSMFEKDSFYINDTNPDFFSLLANIEKDVIENGVRLVLIDYLQLIPWPKEWARKNSNDAIGKISFALKQLAKKLKIPIILLSQLSRESEKREHDGQWTKYKLSDLRDSGSIEQDADVIIFIDRRENKVKFQIEKFRHGALASCSAKFVGDYVRFEDDLDDKPTRIALAYLEKTGKIDPAFEEELKELDAEALQKAKSETIPSSEQGDFNPLWANEETGEAPF